MTTVKHTTYVNTFIPQCHICKDVQNCLLTIDFCTCSIKLSTAFLHDLCLFYNVLIHIICFYYFFCIDLTHTDLCVDRIYHL